MHIHIKPFRFILSNKTQNRNKEGSVKNKLQNGKKRESLKNEPKSLLYLIPILGISINLGLPPRQPLFQYN